MNRFDFDIDRAPQFSCYPFASGEQLIPSVLMCLREHQHQTEITMPAQPILDATLTVLDSSAPIAQPSGVEEIHGVESHAPTRLVCHICGATTSRRGRLFENRADLLRHLRSSHRDVPIGPTGDFSVTSPSPSTAPPAPPRPRVAAPREKAPESPVHAKFCPSCGCNLSVIHAALAFAAEHESF